MERELQQILSRLESRVASDSQAITSEIATLKAALEVAEAKRAQELRGGRFLEAAELRDRIARDLDKMKWLGFMPSDLREPISNGSLSAMFRSTLVNSPEICRHLLS